MRRIIIVVAIVLTTAAMHAQCADFRRAVSRRSGEQWADDG
jgi:hypothetical protein